jgi:hypothetical protein
MQMVNIFNELIISMDDFFILNIEWDLYNYISDNLYIEIHTLSQDLSIALKTNANGKYI